MWNKIQNRWKKISGIPIDNLNAKAGEVDGGQDKFWGTVTQSDKILSNLSAIDFSVGSSNPGSCFALALDKLGPIATLPLCKLICM